MLNLIIFRCFQSSALNFGHTFKLMFYSFHFWPHLLMSWTHFERKIFLGANKIKRLKGAKVKIIFQGLHVTCAFMRWFIVLNYIFFIHILSLCVRYKYVLLHLDPISCIFCIHAHYHTKSTTFVKTTSSKFIIFKIKNTRLNQMCSLNVCVKMNFINFNSFYFLNYQC